MPNILENVGDKTIDHLDYVGSLNIQWWATLRAMLQSFPFVGNRYRWRATLRASTKVATPDASMNMTPAQSTVTV